MPLLRSRLFIKLTPHPHSRQRPPQTQLTRLQKQLKDSKLPHNCEALLKDADLFIDKSSTQKLYDQLYAGVFLNQKKKKYWVDNKSHTNCFMLYARGLSITWGDDSRYWHWSNTKDSNDLVDVAELLNVCWLEASGKFEATMLSPGTLYEFVFVVMLKEAAHGWEIPVNLKLTLPDGNKLERKENLMEKPRGQWIELVVGQFVSCRDKVGEIEFSLYEYNDEKWKEGLLIKGVAIRPKA